MITVRPLTGKPLAWVLAACVILGFPATSWIYWPAVGEAGLLEPESDTIFIPMMGSIFLAVILLPVILGITWLCLRGKKYGGHLLAWDRARPIRSSFVTLAFMVPFFFGLTSLLDELTSSSDWYGLWWLPYTLIVLTWLVVMRGAALSKSNGR